jgi:bacteriocin biosynthesis cyclodehydratase domain-containing protein
MSRLPVRPCLAPGFTVLGGPDRVRLVAGEDCRYTLAAPGLNEWLPAWLGQLDGRRRLDEALALLPEDRRAAAQEMVARLYAERVLTEAPAAAAHTAERYTLCIEGEGRLAAVLRGAAAAGQGGEGRPVPVLAQDNLDYDAALRFNRRCLEGASPWLWITCGPLARGYASPAFLPDAGPCLACLLTHFERLSPAPEIYGDLIAHARRGLPIAAAPFPEAAARLLCDLLLAKAEGLAQVEAPAALFRLHVLEAATLEVSSHRVFIDPECTQCRARR